MAEPILHDLPREEERLFYVLRIDELTARVKDLESKQITPWDKRLMEDTQKQTGDQIMALTKAAKDARDFFWIKSSPLAKVTEKECEELAQRLEVAISPFLIPGM